jgi:hypothetical protein
MIVFLASRYRIGASSAPARLDRGLGPRRSSGLCALESRCFLNDYSKPACGSEELQPHQGHAARAVTSCRESTKIKSPGEGLQPLWKDKNGKAQVHPRRAFGTPSSVKRDVVTPGSAKQMGGKSLADMKQ